MLLGERPRDKSGCDLVLRCESNYPDYYQRHDRTLKGKRGFPLKTQRGDSLSTSKRERESCCGQQDKKLKQKEGREEIWDGGAMTFKTFLQTKEAWAV